LDKRPPLEAQLIDLTDEIAYLTADLDDGMESEIITLADIRKHSKLFENFYGEVQMLYPDAAEKLKANESIKRVLNALAGDLIQTTRTRINAAGVKSVDDVRNAPRRLAGFSDGLEADRKDLKKFLYENL